MKVGYLEGKIIWSDTKNILLEVQGIGYEINYYNAYVASEYGAILNLYVTERKSEFDENLFGFGSIEEKLLFESLISIKGLGARLIFTIMSELKIRSLLDFNTIKLEQLVKLPGVGKTTAQKFLLAISNKLKKEFDLESIKKNDTSSLESQFKNEIDLLKEWGMDKKDILLIIKENFETINDLSSGQLIQFILKQGKK